MSVPEGIAGVTTSFFVQTQAACGIKRVTQYRFPPLTAQLDNVTSFVHQIDDVAVRLIECCGCRESLTCHSAVQNKPTVSSVYDTSGKWTTEFYTTKAATYKLESYLNDVLITQETNVTVVAGPPIASLSSLANLPTSFQSGMTANFDIISFDNYSTRWGWRALCGVDGKLVWCRVVGQCTVHGLIGCCACVANPVKVADLFLVTMVSGTTTVIGSVAYTDKVSVGGFRRRGLC